MYRHFIPLLLLGLLQPLHGAQLVVNGSFTDDLAGWSVNGGVSHSDDFALLEEDPLAASNALFQTVGAPGELFLLRFELFIAGMSIAVPGGTLPDSAFGTAYFGDTPFGSDASSGSYSESLALFDLDRDGVRLLADGMSLANIASRPGWVELSVEFATEREQITLVIEEFSLNFIFGDSVVAVDEVSLLAIPEPSALLLCSCALAGALFRRKPNS